MICINIWTRWQIITKIQDWYIIKDCRKLNILSSDLLKLSGRMSYGAVLIRLIALVQFDSGLYCLLRYLWSSILRHQI